MPAPDRGAASSALPPHSWSELERLVDGALDLPAAERGAYLERAVGSDAGLREAALRLLDACIRADSPQGLFATPAAVFAAPLVADLEGDAEGAPGAAADSLAEEVRAALAGRYEVLRVLGRGGMATVFLARDIRHERAVAVKVVDRHAGPAGSARFLREIRTAARLTHPHVLGVHDSGEANGLLFYVMPFVEGETLRERLAREGALPIAEATRLLRELADGLAHAHRHGVVHCDLKPENVLLAEGHAVVADFGIARAIAAVSAGDATPSHGLGLLGTPGYMAPEQASGGGVDHRSDLYALGVIGYELLAGMHPFARRFAGALPDAHRAEAPVPLETRRADCPAGLAALVMRLLARDPAARPETARAVLTELERASGPGARPARRVRIGAGLAMLILLLGLMWGGWRLRAPAGAVPDVHFVAVLPFVNAGGTAADEYFSDGIADELAHALGALPGVQLAGRTSSLAFKGRAATPQEIGRALRVGAFVSGAVRRSGERLRVSAELVRTADGKVLWDSVFESRSGDVFEVQDQLVAAMRASLQAVLGPAARSATPVRTVRGTTDQEAYDLYLQGRFHFQERGRDNVVRAIRYFRAATEHDSSFARAHAGLAFAYGVLPSYEPGTRDSVPDLVRTSAVRAFSLDSTLADARLAMGLAEDFRLRLTDARRHYEAALTIEPSNVFGHHLLGFLLNGAGWTEEAIAALRRATQLDPLAKSAGAALAGALTSARRYPEAIAESRRILALDPDFPLAQAGLAGAQAFGGELDSAIAGLERARHDPAAIMQRDILLYALAAAGRWPEAARLRAEIRALRDDPSAGTAAAFAELVFGDREPLVRLLATEAGQRGWYDTHVGFGCNPLLDPLWTDARFRAAMARLEVPVCTLARPWPFSPPGER